LNLRFLANNPLFDFCALDSASKRSSNAHDFCSLSLRLITVAKPFKTKATAIFTSPK